MRTVTAPTLAPADAEQLEDAVLAAVASLREKGRPVATYLQIIRSDAVADWLEAHMSYLALGYVAPALDALVKRGRLTRDGVGWGLAERELIAKT